jgi:hypothetical protein
MSEFTANYQSAFEGSAPSPTGDHAAHARLRSLLTQAPKTATKPASHWSWTAWAVVSLCALLLGVATLEKKQSVPSSTQAMVSRLETEITPNPRLTPGDISVVSKAQVCQANGQGAARQIPESLKRAVLAEYGVNNAPQETYEVDFLITPELGGSANIRNLWPEPYFSRTWNARVKDALEDRLHKLVCDGSLDLSTAQREIATNWVDAYKKYVRPDNPM